MKGLELLNKLKEIQIYKENDNQCSDLGNCCEYKGELSECYPNEISIIEKELKAFNTLKPLLDAIEEEFKVEPITFLLECIHVRNNSNLTIGYTTDNQEIHSDYGYIEDFLSGIVCAIKNRK